MDRPHERPLVRAVGCRVGAATSVLREAITEAMQAKTNESPSIKSKMDDVAEAVAAVKRHLIGALPKMRSAGSGPGGFRAFAASPSGESDSLATASIIKPPRRISYGPQRRSRRCRPLPAVQSAAAVVHVRHAAAGRDAAHGSGADPPP